MPGNESALALAFFSLSPYATIMDPTIRSTGSIVMQSGSDSNSGNSSAMITMLLSPVSIVALVVIVVTLLIVVVTAAIDRRQQQRSKQRNSLRRRSRGALIDFGLMWSTMCGLLATATKDKDNSSTSVVEQAAQQPQTVSAKKFRKCKTTFIR